MITDAFQRRLTPFGLKVFGAVALAADEIATLPDVATEPVAILVGNAGPAMWKVLSQDLGGDGNVVAHAHPMNTWTRRIIEKVCHDVASDMPQTTASKPIQVVFPFDGPPYYPFQKWAIRTGQFFPSPIGPLVHSEFGLWAGFRAAIICAREVIDQVSVGSDGSPCDSCAEKPCLSTCPVDAFRPDGYDVPTCTTFLRTAESTACMTGGCLARRACPIGDTYKQTQAQSQFHINKFLAANG